MYTAYFQYDTEKIKFAEKITGTSKPGQFGTLLLLSP
jgi:hypothetical protein